MAPNPLQSVQPFVPHPCNLSLLPPISAEVRDLYLPPQTENGVSVYFSKDGTNPILRLEIGPIPAKKKKKKGELVSY